MLRMDTLAMYAALAPSGHPDALRCATQELWIRMGALSRRYMEPHRRYHTLRHLDHGFLQHHARVGAMKPDVFFAWAYHDAIYDPRAKDNEERSAELFLKDNELLGFSPDQADWIASLILGTKHTGMKSLITDIDLSILGADRPVYDNYVREVRGEYSFVSERDWRAGRTDVLIGFVTQKIFVTPEFASLEEPARLNLHRELKRLRKK
jgi:predicted metal-dependent HD superfamily phosphohydrolase